MSARLAFVDDPARLAEVPDGFDVVAVEPAVALAAPGATPLDAELDDLELEALGEETYALAERIGDALGPTGAWRLPELKALVDGLLAHALGARRLVEATGAAETRLLLRRGSLAEAALVSVLGGPPHDAPPSPAPPPAGGRLAATALGLRRRLRRRRPRVLLLDERYNLPPIAAALRERGADVLLWLPPPARPAPPRPLSVPPELLRAGGLDLWAAAEPFLRRLAADAVPRDEAALRAAEAAIRRDRPDALLASTYAAPAAKAAAVAARAAGVPSFVSRHGEQGIRALPVMRLNDLDVVEHALCWGEWEAAFVARHAPRPVATTVVGAPMIDDVAARAPGRDEIRRELGLGGGERVALLVPTALSGEDWYAGRRLPPDLAYVRHQLVLVEQLLSVPGLRVVVREHASGEGPLETWARSSGAPLTFVRERPFAELVHLADALVLDFPSTTLVQALCGSSRLYVVRHPVTAWEPGVLEHLERHGVRIVDPDALADAVAADPAGPVRHPRAALELLAASGPGTAAERAADALLALL
ncbi:MAG TPA: hypothetical protein VFJ91_09735 [Gaiellaceae bacterium]|nr:hypothetical protein [Gaiellaceae bacterium]